MNNSLSRRDWFKSTAALSAGLMVSTSMLDRLMAAPISRDERDYVIKNLQGKVKLNSNENPYGPSEKAKKAALESLAKGNRYAFEELEEFKKFMAAKNGVDPSYVLLGAGSGELLCQTGIAYGLEGGRVLSAYPTFPLLM